MRAIIYSSREEAERAQRALDEAYGLPRVHGPTEYEHSAPGRAAGRLLERGVRTDHARPLIAHPDGLRFATPAEAGEAMAVDLDDTWTERPLREARR